MEKREGIVEISNEFRDDFTAWTTLAQFMKPICELKEMARHPSTQMWLFESDLFEPGRAEYEVSFSRQMDNTFSVQAIKR
ncbi:hypothetical protein [Spirosoma foliorum]|uniref:Uncharacterized protein n=1 Tax=Spirosoma foliorum TaxID=2710596 RepID=A0A7G5H2H9_9BACT|nr:hypothetical protein [Spirosoma foliorum]QMW05321.1 hypothetical protein H3H32_10750 [Spirosoma foliorum]